MNCHNRLFSFCLRHIRMHPLGNQYSTDSLSMYLVMHDPAKLSHESGKMFEVTLSILNQEQGQHYSRAGFSSSWHLGVPTNVSWFREWINRCFMRVVLRDGNCRSLCIQWKSWMGMGRLHSTQDTEGPFQRLPRGIKVECEGGHHLHWVNQRCSDTTCCISLEGREVMPLHNA